MSGRFEFRGSAMHGLNDRIGDVVRRVTCFEICPKSVEFALKVAHWISPVLKKAVRHATSLDPLHQKRRPGRRSSHDPNATIRMPSFKSVSDCQKLNCSRKKQLIAKKSAHLRFRQKGPDNSGSWACLKPAAACN
ncbi:hypothetical protein BRAS3843_1640026 [Bradyrhizobium sp. STM 3843]|nr:hypothetical protein BRAS3843_1640026 [Bradyrhizobium sp. STM 3843]